MVPGLFHRAILLSGSAFSSWALVDDPVVYALKLAKEVNCSIPDDLIKNHEEIVDCLRNAPLEDLYAADIQSPSFLTAFGPSVCSASEKGKIFSFYKKNFFFFWLTGRRRCHPNRTIQSRFGRSTDSWSIEKIAGRFRSLRFIVWCRHGWSVMEI